jgi:hypothetical protein
MAEPRLFIANHIYGYAVQNAICSTNMHTEQLLSTLAEEEVLIYTEYGI